MEQIGLAFLLFAAFWVGCAAGYIAMRLRAQVAYESGRSDSASEIATLTERLATRDQQLAELRRPVETGDAAAPEVTRAGEWVEPLKGSLERVETLLLAQAATGQPAQPVAEWVEPIKHSLGRVESLLEAHASSAQPAQPGGEWLEPIQTSLGRVEALLHSQAEGSVEAQASAGQWADPIKVSLERVDSRIAELEKERTAELTTLRQQVETLMQSQAALVSALRTPASPGAWGEIQLRRIVEMSGMSPNCDFIESPGGEGASQPNLLVRLPNHRHILIDASVSLAALGNPAAATSAEDRAAGVRQFATEIRAHIARLGGAAYWEQFAQKPEFVVAFLPGEGLFGAALEGDAGLLEYGAENRVLLATPATLIALLRSVAWGWKQELATADVVEIRDLGQTLYQQLTAAAAEFAGVQQSMAATTIAFNRAFGSFESGVMPSARRLRELAPTPAASLQHLASAASTVDEEPVKVL